MGNKSKKSLADLSDDLDLQNVMKKNDMTKIFGGTLKGIRSGWNSSCGGIVPQ